MPQQIGAASGIHGLQDLMSVCSFESYRNKIFHSVLFNTSDEWHSQSQEKCIYGPENPQSTKMMRKVIKSHVLGVDTSM